MTREEARELLQTTPIDIRSPRDDLSPADYFEALNMAIEALQERPKGRWEKTKFAGEHLCSNCQAITYFEFIVKHGYKEYDFCPNCGADMRESGQE